ncbi:MAG: 5-formyltetrahydrofolate cyclo-ligase [bacterium P3]|nr:MAG: 5-formyltetrahydrofolate cyclo-ligase [bacterium P3]KWW41988.1 MAG: 5-formyltetrahydrofolate cyclo-ligase [bacterium F083]
MDKTTLRREIRAAKKAVPFHEKAQRSEAIMQQVAALPRFADARVVLLYWSMDDEVQTHRFVERWRHEKTILLPCVDGDRLRLRVYEGLDRMIAGEQFGIGEPVGDEFTDYDRIDLVIVPGVAFDQSGNRMGRGRGFYDRLLQCTPRAYKIGVAFSFQMRDAIPVEPHDIAMDLVVSEAEPNTRN